MHKFWCGKACSECETPCKLDESIPCSPDCEFLNEDGSATASECQHCDALPLYRVPISYDGAVYIRASSAEDARERVCGMRVDEMYTASDGSWAIDEAEETS